MSKSPKAPKVTFAERMAAQAEMAERQRATADLVAVIVCSVMFEQGIAPNILRETMVPLWNQRLNECERLLADIAVVWRFCAHPILHDATIHESLAHARSQCEPR